MKIFAIGDVHGEFELLQKAIESIVNDLDPSGQNLVVFLGDYVDRGPHSAEVVDLIKTLVEGDPTHFQAILGNHEVLLCDNAKILAALPNIEDPTMQQKLTSRVNNWLAVGGAETVQSYRQRPDLFLDEHVQWLQTLPTMIQTPHHVFVHAGIDQNVPLDQQQDEVVMWIRKWEDAYEHVGDEDSSVHKHVVYGHAARRAPRLLSNSSGLDSGACFYGTLAVGVFDSDKPGGPKEVWIVRKNGTEVLTPEGA